MKTELTDTQREHQHRAMAIPRLVVRHAENANAKVSMGHPDQAAMIVALIGDDVAETLKELEAMK